MKASLTNKVKILVLVILSNMAIGLHGQTISFGVSSASSALSFDFTTVQQYQAGIVRYNAYELLIDVSGTQWDLYVGATTTNPGFLDVITNYSTTGTIPPVSLIQMQFRNSFNTSLMSGFFPLTDISTPTYIIGTTSAPDLTIPCPNVGANTAGNYLTNPGCFKFNVDIKIIPGFAYRSGLYTLRIDYILIQDL